VPNQSRQEIQFIHISQLVSLPDPSESTWEAVLDCVNLMASRLLLHHWRSLGRTPVSTLMEIGCECTVFSLEVADRYAASKGAHDFRDDIMYYLDRHAIARHVNAFFFGGLIGPSRTIAQAHQLPPQKYVEALNTQRRISAEYAESSICSKIPQFNRSPSNQDDSLAVRLQKRMARFGLDTTSMSISLYSELARESGMLEKMDDAADAYLCNRNVNLPLDYVDHLD